MSKGGLVRANFGRQSGLLGRIRESWCTCAGCFDVYGEYWGGAGGSPRQGTWAKSYPINGLGQNQTESDDRD
jgi:hypothetical protein